MIRSKPTTISLTFWEVQECLDRKHVHKRVPVRTAGRSNVDWLSRLGPTQQTRAVQSHQASSEGTTESNAHNDGLEVESESMENTGPESDAVSDPDSTIGLELSLRRINSININQSTRKVHD